MLNSTEYNIYSHRKGSLEIIMEGEFQVTETHDDSIHINAPPPEIYNCLQFADRYM